LAWLIFTWSTAAGAATAMLSEWDEVEGVEVAGHERHEKLRMRPIYP
jgi:hypothetical protein